jgi:hypothetical protein
MHDVGFTVNVMFGFLRRLHTELKAWFSHGMRVREVEHAFRAAHAQELTLTPLANLPLVKARQALEIDKVRAGQLSIVDRQSWQYPYLPATVQRLSMPVAKTTPYNLRRFSRTPVARRAINLIKNAVIQQPWEIRAMTGAVVDDENEQLERIKIASKVFSHPNNVDSHQSFIEMGIEDMCIMGAMVTELSFTPDPKRPLKMWMVNVESIRIFVSWSESTPDLPHYAQMTGLQGERGAILFYDDELMYVRDNPATDNPFGLGKLEVAFQSLNDFLGVQRMAGMAGSDQVHKSWLWWEQPQTDQAYQVVRRHIQNELEGQAKISIIGGMKKPDVIEVQPTTEDDLLLNWQEMLIRMIGNAFDMSGMALGIEHDVNRAVGEVLQDQDFRAAVVPMAKRLQEAFTRKVLHERLGWKDLEFVYMALDDPDLETKSDMNSRMYSANALTPNEWRTSVGKKKLDTPFADLTQFESMMVNMQVEADLAEQAAQNQMSRQVQMSEMMGPQGGPQEPGDSHQQGPAPAQQQGKPPQQGPPAAGDSHQAPPSGGKGGMQQQPPNNPMATMMKLTPGNISRGGQPQSPKAMSLPKFPVAGSKWTARQIAMMPVNELSDRIMGGQLPKAHVLLKHMRAQEPSILEQMTDEVRQFFETQLEIKEQEDQQEEVPDAKLKEWSGDLKKKMRKGQKRITDMTEYLKEIGHDVGKPGHRSRNVPYKTSARKPGRPGTPPPPRGI